MTATPLTLDEGTDLRSVADVAPESIDALPSRRRQREQERSADAEDRIPALAALDAAVEFVLVVRDGDRFRIFSEGGLVAQDPDGREVQAGTEGEELEGCLPILVARHEDGEDLADAEELAEPVHATDVDDPDELFESLLDLGAAAQPVEDTDPAQEEAESAGEAVEAEEPADEAVQAEEPGDEAEERADEQGETNRVPGFVRGSAGVAVDDPAGEADAHLALALVLEDGRRIAADHTVLLGRSPSPRTEPAEQIALDPALTDISRNHLEIRLDGDAVVAIDLGSTNGTVLTRAGQPPRLVPTDEAVRLLPGDSLNLGGSAIVEVEAL